MDEARWTLGADDFILFSEEKNDNYDLSFVK
jgi:hypothetical protein